MVNDSTLLLHWNSSNSLGIRGEMDERNDLSSLQQCAGQLLYVDLSQVNPVNSFGLKLWIQTIRKHRIQLILQDCSPVEVEHLNLVPQFLGKDGVVESFYARYHCETCSYEQLERYQPRLNLDLHDPKIAHHHASPCLTCGSTLELDQWSELFLSSPHYTKTSTPRAS